MNEKILACPKCKEQLHYIKEGWIIHRIDDYDKEADRVELGDEWDSDFEGSFSCPHCGNEWNGTIEELLQAGRIIEVKVPD